jgi:hypothetical protein
MRPYLITAKLMRPYNMKRFPTPGLTANIGQVGSIVTVLFISFFQGRMFSRWIVMNITSDRGTLHCRKTLSLRGSTRDL